MSAAATEVQNQTVTLAEAVIKQHCKQLHLPAIAGQCARLAEEAEREHHSYLGYLDVLLQAELEERERVTAQVGMPAARSGEGPAMEQRRA